MVTNNRIAAIGTLLATVIFVSFSHVVQYGIAAPKQSFFVDSHMAFESQKHVPFSNMGASSIARLEGDSQNTWNQGDSMSKLNSGSNYPWHHNDKYSSSIVNIQKDECSSTSLANGGAGNGGNGGAANGGNGGAANGGNGGTGVPGSPGGTSNGAGGGNTSGAPGTGGPSNASSQTACSNKSTFNS